MSKRKYVDLEAECPKCESTESVYFVKRDWLKRKETMKIISGTAKMGRNKCKPVLDDWHDWDMSMEDFKRGDYIPFRNYYCGRCNKYLRKVIITGYCVEIEEKAWTKKEST